MKINTTQIGDITLKCIATEGLEIEVFHDQKIISWPENSFRTSNNSSSKINMKTRAML